MFSGTIDAATKRDVPRIARLEKECFAMPWSRSSIRTMLGMPRIIFVAAREVPGGPLIGYAAMETVLDEGYVYNVGVAPEARRRGVGRALMEYLIEEGRRKELAFISLEVRQSNAPAIAMYDRLGFVRAGLRKDYYKKPTEDALIMTLLLSEPQEELDPAVEKNGELSAPDGESAPDTGGIILDG